MYESNLPSYEFAPSACPTVPGLFTERSGRSVVLLPRREFYTGIDSQFMTLSTGSCRHDASLNRETLDLLFEDKHWSD